MESLLGGILELINHLDPRVALLLFGICAVGELGIITIPYILEGAWLLIGYQLGAGLISPLFLLGFWAAAQAGRQAGAISLFYLLRAGTSPFIRLYNRYRLWRFVPRGLVNSGTLKRINLATPFSVALGRLIGLRFPITMMLSVKKDLKTLAFGVVLSSIVWDAIYLVLGVTAGATAAIKPSHLFLYSLGGLALIYLITLLVRRLRKPRETTGEVAPDNPGK